MIRINVVGDIMLGDQFCSFGFGVRSKYKNRYNRLIDDSTLKALRDCDYLVGNLECSINNSKDFRFDTHVLCADNEGIDWLKELGFDALSLANNHSLERGPEGLYELKSKLEQSRLNYFGTREVPYLKVEKEGMTIGLYGYTAIKDYKNREDIELFDTENSLKKVKDIAGQVDVLIVFPHWGNEFITTPSEEQITTGRKLIEAGASVVVGAHPHVLQPVERYKEGLILYSTGNFIFDSYSQETFPTAIFQIQIHNDKNCELKVIPVQAKSNYSLSLADPSQSEEIRKIINSEVGYLEPEEYNRKVNKLRSVYRKQTLVHLSRNFLRFKDYSGIFSWGLGRLVFVWKNRKKEKSDPSSVYGWSGTE